MKQRLILLICLFGILNSINVVQKEVFLQEVHTTTSYEPIFPLNNPIYTLSSLQYVPHAPIVIIDELDFHSQASSKGWDLGGTRDGSSSNPYVIEGLSITGPADKTLIEIQNSQLHFQIRNCLLTGGKDGISLSDVAFGDIYGNNISNNVLNGINILSSVNQTNIEANNISHNGHTGITHTGVHNSISHNIITNSLYGIRLIDSEENTVFLNTVSNNSENGILLTNSDFNLVTNNTVFTTHPLFGYGIRLSSSDENTVSANTVYNNSYGITLGYSVKGLVTGNRVFNNSADGIFIVYSEQITVSHNLVYNNVVDGISFKTTHNGTISHNTVLTNTENGIWVRGSDNNLITNNIVANNTENGIWVRASENNSFSCNNITGNVNYGITLLTTSAWGNNNNVTFNNFIANSWSGISQAYDEGLNNVFYSNYWSNWISGGYPIDGSASNTDSSPVASPIDITNCSPSSISSSGVSTPFVGFFTLIFSLLTLMGLGFGKKKGQM